MSYRTIDGLTKFRAVKALIQGESIASVSKRLGVSRASLYGWMEVSLQAMEDYFQGRLLHRNKVTRTREKLKADFLKSQSRLEKKIAARERKLEKLAEQIRDLKDRGRPRKCGACGCEKIYKNGFYAVSLDYFKENLGKNKPSDVKIRNYICASCAQSISVVDPWRNQFRVNKQRQELPRESDSLPVALPPAEQRKVMQIDIPVTVREKRR
jgi:transposase-like protein